MKIILGAAQFGLDYGISNAGGKVSGTEVESILSSASDYGIHDIDTARLYGNSEEVIGGILNGDTRFRLMTKTAHFSAPEFLPADGDTVLSDAEESLTRLRAKELEAILFHDGGVLLRPGGEYLYLALKKCRESGICRRTGISVYDTATAMEIMRKFPVDIIQFPMNIFNREFASKEFLEGVGGVELHARSVFLQGLLLMANPPDYFHRFGVALEKFRNRCRETGRTPMELAVNCIRFSPVHGAVFGVTSRRELTEIREVWAGETVPADVTGLEVTDPDLINPGRWPSFRTLAS